ncbi:MAG TPA: DNA repair protein RadC [Bacilli bacterium]|nr:DNA repair protein RadC [Bacilli bacterium]
MLIKELPNEEKPRERLKNYGVSSLSNEELIAIILRSGTKNISVKEVSQSILKELDNISLIENITINKLLQIKGIGEVKAISLIASIELGKRIYTKQIVKNKIKISCVKDIYNLFKDYFINKTQEEFVVIYLDTKHYLIDYKVLFIGTIDQSIIHPREIFKNAYLMSSSAIICLHNHPSGISNPSNEDIILTKKILEISKLMLIPLVDHIIIGKNEYYSFLENGHIK